MRWRGLDEDVGIEEEENPLILRLNVHFYPLQMNIHTLLLLTRREIIEHAETQTIIQWAVRLPISPRPLFIPYPGDGRSHQLDLLREPLVFSVLREQGLWLSVIRE